MGRRATLVRISVLMVEFTSLPLIVLASIYLLSGYQMLNPEIRMIPEPRKIHTDKILRALTIVLTYLHTLGGIIIVVERRLREEPLRRVIRAAMTAALTVLLIFLLLVETTL